MNIVTVVYCKVIKTETAVGIAREYCWKDPSSNAMARKFWNKSHRAGKLCSVNAESDNWNL